MARILVAAGGTGGHVYPALAVAERLRAAGHEVHFAGGDRIERRLVPEAGFELHELPARALPRRPTPALLSAGVAFGASLRLARGMVRDLGVRAVLGMGGYPSLAPSMAASSLGVPVVLHEQNAVLSLAHRLSVRRARTLALSLPIVQRRVPSSVRVVETGNPLRDAIRAFVEATSEERARHRAEALGRFGLAADATTVVVTGGSLGAKALNDAVVGLGDALGDAQVLHVAGPDHEERVAAAWSGSARRVHVVGYLERMQDAWAVADLVVSRSGASTVAELAAAGLPAVLVPLPIAPGGAQEANARVLADAGAALTVLQGDGFERRLAEAVAAVVASPERLMSMAAAAARFAKPDATERVAAEVEGVLPDA